MMERATEVEKHLTGHLRYQKIFNPTWEESTVARQKMALCFPFCIHNASIIEEEEEWQTRADEKSSTVGAPPHESNTCADHPIRLMVGVVPAFSVFTALAQQMPMVLRSEGSA